jgi:MYXO-CTERM domain-containing protein
MRVGGGDGHLLDQTPRTIGNSNSGRRLSATWDGNEYVVLAIHTQGDNPFELRGHRVSRDNLVMEPDWFTITPIMTEVGVDTGTGSDGVFLGGGRAFLVYDRFLDPDATGNTRVRGRVIASAPEPAADAGAGDAGKDAGAPVGDAAPAPADAGAPAGQGGGCGCRMGGTDRGAGLVGVVVLGFWLCRRRR